ncbi:MAG: translocation/assembly module TamB domain-containing protein [Marinibacterium sp.]|nr:translocation/assembly module TamB domain-containing protein [Marinibacterium sp.]
MTRRLTYVLSGALLLTGPAALAQSDDTDAGGPLVRLLENTLSNDDRRIEVIGLQGALSARATIEELRVSDDDGAWFTLKDAVLDWNRLALVRGRFSVNELSAQSIEIARLPDPPSDPEPKLPSPETEPFSLPELPVAIEIAQLSIGTVALGEPVIGAAAELSVNGRFNLAGGALDTLLSVARTDKTGDALSLKAGYANDTRVIDLDVTLTEAAGGLLGTALDIPGTPSLAFTAKGNGPLDDFTANIGLATEGVRRFGGTVDLRGTPAADGGDTQALGFAADLGGDLTPLMVAEFHPFFGTSTALTLDGVRQPSGALSIRDLTLSSAAVDLTASLDLSDSGAPIRGQLNGLIAPTGADDRLVLPVPGGETTIESASLTGQIDGQSDEDWDLDLIVTGFANPDTRIDTLSLSGDGTITLGEATALAGSIAAAVQGLGLSDDTLSTTMGDTLQLTGDFDLPGDGTLGISDLHLFGAGADARGSARISGLGSGFSLDGQASLSVADLGRFAALTGQDLSGALRADLTGKGAPLGGDFDIVLNGTAQDLALGIAQADALLVGETVLRLDAERGTSGIALRDLSLRNPQLEVTGTGALSSTGTQADLTATLDDLGKVVPQLPGPASLRATLAQDDTVWTGDLRVDGPDAIFATLTGDVTTTGGADLDLDAAFPGLERFVPQLVGTATLTGTVERDADSGEAMAKLRLEGPQDLMADIDGTVSAEKQADLTLAAAIGALEALVPQLEGQARLDGTLRADLDAQSAHADLTLTAPQDIAASVKGTVAMEDATDLTIRASLPQMQSFVPQLPGAAQLDGRLTRPSPADPWVADVDLSAPEDIRAAIDASLAADGTTDLDINAALPRLEIFVPQLPGAATLIARADRAAGSSDWAAQANLTAPQDISATIDANANTDSQALDLRYLARVPQLQSFVPQLVGLARLSGDLSRDAKGVWAAQTQLSAPTNITAQIDATMTEGGPLDAHYDATIPQLDVFVPQLPGAATLTGDVTRADTGEDWAGTLRLRAPGEITADLDAQANLNGPVDATLTARMPDLDRFVPQLTGGLTLDAQLTRANATADWIGSVDLDGPQGLVLDANTAADLDGAVKATLDAGFDRIDLFVPQLVGPVALTTELDRAGNGRDWTGQSKLTAPGGITADLGGTLSQQGDADIRFDASVPGMERFVPEFPGTLQAKGTATRSDAQWTVDTDLQAPGGTSARVTGGYDETAGTADLDISGGVQLGSLNTIIAPNSIQGGANYDLALKGPPGLDALSGTITVNNVGIAIPALQNAINNFGGSVTLNGAQAQIALGGSMRTGGQLRIDGPLGLQPPFNSNVDVTLDALTLSDGLSYETVMDGGIRLSGPVTGGANLTGRIDVGETEINIATVGGAPGAAAIPEITHVGESEAALLTRQRAGLVVKETTEEDNTSSGPPIGLDVTISAPNRVFVRGRGLESELGGEIRIRGNTNNIRPEGSIELLRGSLSILARRLDLSRGVVSLSGTLEPDIDFAATTTTSEGDATLTIQGPLSDPSVEVTSDPQRPSEEALAMLVFGDQFSNLSPVKIAQLAASLARLSGTGGGLTTGIREGLGLDSVDFTTDKDGNAAVGVGTYVSENIYTDVTVNARGDSEVNINLDLSDSFTVKGSVDNKSDTSIGIFFERDY